MARRGLGHAVELRGTVPQADLPLYYSAADVLAMPSAYESFGMAALEAMACGTPVVAYRVGGLAELVQHGFTGFLAEPGNIKEFAALLERVLRSNRREQMGRNGAALARRFRWEGVAERTMNLYEETLYRQRFVAARAAGR
jgi:D-inositol-3-phosphate glycosyltransferase